MRTLIPIAIYFCVMVSHSSAFDPYGIERSGDGSNSTPAPPLQIDLSKVDLSGEDLRHANLYGVDLSFSDLRETDLRGADLREADLSFARTDGIKLDGAKLAGADLSGVVLNGRVSPDKNLRKVKLNGASLRGARLSYADLSWAVLDGSDLSEADLGNANLMGAKLLGAKLERANLERANLNQAYLQWAYLVNANLQKAKLPNIYMFGVDLQGSDMSGSDLTKSNLTEAILENVNLESANLKGANLSRANLDTANLSGANVSGVNLSGASVEDVLFEIRKGHLPDPLSLRLTKGLEQLRYVSNPDSLVSLRKRLDEMGFEYLAKKITHAINRSNRINDFNEGNYIEAYFSYVFFEVTVGYGLYPGRPLLIIAVLIVFFWAFYLVALTEPNQTETKEQAGVYRVVAASGTNERIYSIHPSVLILALYFSLLSAFHIGWRDLNVGNWISRLQPREYLLKSVGWVRVISGVQSLISVYLVALWVLSYFGRPFG